jgi:hypothetical protein
MSHATLPIDQVTSAAANTIAEIIESQVIHALGISTAKRSALSLINQYSSMKATNCATHNSIDITQQSA